MNINNHNKIIILSNVETLLFLINLNIIDNWNIDIKEKNKGLFMIGIFFMINIYYVTPIKIIYKYDLINRTGIYPDFSNVGLYLLSLNKSIIDNQ